MALTTRTAKGSALTFAEMDANLNGLADGSNLTASQKKKECTAWVVFNGTDGTILDSFNVASVVHNSVGNATINFIKCLTKINDIKVGLKIAI